MTPVEALEWMSHGNSVKDGNGVYSVRNGVIVLRYWDDVQPPVDGNEWIFHTDDEFLRVEKEYKKYE